MANFFSDVTDVNYRLIRPCVMGMVSSSVTAGALRRGLGSGGRVGHGMDCCYYTPESEGQNCKAWALAQRCERMLQAAAQEHPLSCGQSPRNPPANGPWRVTPTCKGLHDPWQHGLVGMLLAYRYGSRKISSYIKYVLQCLDLGSEIAERLGLLMGGGEMQK